jgi:hypothetical protein
LIGLKAIDGVAGPCAVLHRLDEARDQSGVPLVQVLADQFWLLKNWCSRHCFQSYCSGVRYDQASESLAS